MLEMWVIYNNPRDYPDKFVVRRRVILDQDGVIFDIPDPEPLIVTGNLEEARAAIPEDTCNLGRFDADEPQILEVWI